MLQSERDHFEPVSEINVTPFVDVLLVLLVIFMITAPLFTKAVKVDLPKENLRSSSVRDVRKFVISIDRKGRFYIRGKRYNLKNLLQVATAWKLRNEGETAFIRADKRVKYGQITSLMVTLKNSGIHNIGLLVGEKTKKR